MDARKPTEEIVLLTKEGKIWKEECQCAWVPRYPKASPETATIQIFHSQNIVLKNLIFKNAWPTHIGIVDSKNISIMKNSFYGGTFAIHAEGEKTHSICLDSNYWSQDTTIDHKLWNEWEWKHAHHGRRGYLNGAFFGSENIRGNILISKNIIHDAFNVLRMDFDQSACLNKDCARYVNKDVTFINNELKRIRDNVIEPEWIANGKWYIAYNEITNAHADISLDSVHNPDKKGLFLLFKNRFIKHSKPSMNSPLGTDVDLNNGGKILKLPKKKLTLHECDGQTVNGYPFINLVLQENYIDTYQDEQNTSTNIMKGIIPRGTALTNWGKNQIEGECKITSFGAGPSLTDVCDSLSDKPIMRMVPPRMIQSR